MTDRQDELENREKRRRAALRDLRASDFATRRAALLELKSIHDLDRTAPIGEAAGLSIDELRARVPARVSSRDIPYPPAVRARFWIGWRPRAGSTSHDSP